MAPETQQLLSALGSRLGAGGVLAGSDVDQRYRDDPDAAAKLIHIGEHPVDDRIDVVELAAYTTVAGLILNLDETITKE